MRRYIKKIIVILALIVVLAIAFYKCIVNATASQTPVSDSKLKYFNVTLTDINTDEFDEKAIGSDANAENHTVFVTSEKLLGDNQEQYKAKYYQGYANKFSCYSKPTARQNIIQDRLSSDNIVLNYKNANGMELFPTRSQAEDKGLVGPGKPYQEILRNWEIPFIRESSGYFSLDSDKYQISRNYSRQKLELHEDNNNQTLGFFPFNNLDEATTWGASNASFTMRIDIPFWMTPNGKIVNLDSKQLEDMIFEFNGDDDVWVFVDNQLVLDIGGMHDKVTGTINFAKNTSYVSRVYNAGASNYDQDSYCTDNYTKENVFGSNKLSEGSHTLKIFYTERGGNKSNFKARFNLTETTSYSGTKVWNHNGNNGTKPNSYTLKLYGNGKFIKQQTFTNTNWSFDNIYKYDYETGQEMDYSVQEDEITVDGGKYIPSINDTTVTNTFKKTAGSLTVKHVDKFNNSNVLATEEKSGEIGENVSTSKKDIPGYTFVQGPDTENYTIQESPQTVTYYYAKNSKIITKYLEEGSNQVLHTQDEQTKYEGQEYSTTKENISGYVYTRDTGNTKGTMGHNDIEVIYYYKKAGAINVKHLDKYTNDELATESKTGDIGEKVTTSSKEIPGYTLVQKPDTEDYTITEDDQTVKYYYAKNTNIHVKYLDEVTNEPIEAEETKSGHEGEDYTTEKKDIENYEYTKDSGNTKGKFQHEDIEVIYYYKYKGQVIVHHKDKNTDEELDTDTLEGLEGETVTTNPKDIPEYKLVERPEKEELPVEKEPQEVTYYYVHVAGGVLVKHIDIITDELLEEPEEIKGYEGDDYSTSKKDFKDFEFVKDSENTSGKMTKDLIEVRYYYIHKTQLTVRHILGKNGGEQSSEETGYENEPYTTEPLENPIGKDNRPYKLDETKIPTNKEGVFTKEPVEVIYYYIPKSDGLTVNHYDKITGEKIADSTTQEGWEGDPYTTDPVEVENYELVETPENAKGFLTEEPIEVDYYYLRKTSITVNHIDEKTDEKLLTEDLKGLESQKYETSEKEFDNYDLVEEKYPENAKGVFAREPFEVNYYYIAKSKITVKHVDKSTGETIEETVTEGHEGDKGTTEPKDIPYYKLVEEPEERDYELTKEPQEKVYYYEPLNFNISLDKKLTGIILNGVEYGPTDKFEIGRKEQISSLKLKYVITVKNDSELDGSTTIYDYIPDGYTMIPDENLQWNVEGNKASINIDNIAVGETKEYEVVITANSSEVFGAVVNTAKAENSQCEANFDETTLDDNEGKAELILEINTGLENNIKAIIFIALGILTVSAIVLIKKRNQIK